MTGLSRRVAASFNKALVSAVRFVPLLQLERYASKYIFEFKE